MILYRLARGVRDTLRLLSPAVRAERDYTRRRDRTIAAELAAAEAGGRGWPGGRSWGAALDERVVELPWVLARLGGGERLLDVGSTLNTPSLIRRALQRYRRLVFLNPYPDDGYRASAAGVSYVTRDVRAHGQEARSFEVVTCVSTLEHIGCDNTRYGAPPGREADPAAARLVAMRAMRELCAAGGRLLLTVPVGRLEDRGWLVQLDAAALEAAVAAFGPVAAEISYFLHDGAWRAATASECAESSYGVATRGAGAVACVELRA